VSGGATKLAFRGSLIPINHERCAGCSGAFLPPSPPAEKATARQDQAGKSSTGNRAGDAADGCGEESVLGATGRSGTTAASGAAERRGSAR
jgi:hypothetical protein